METEISGLTGRSSLLRNTAWLAWSGTTNIANSVVLWLALARWREPAEVGQFAAAMSVYTIFTLLCTVGLGPYLTSELARRRARGPFVASAVALIGGWSMLCAFVMCATGYLASTSATARLATLVLSLALLPTGLCSVAEALFTALGRARVIALATTTENLLRTVIPLYLLYRGHSLPVICLAFVALRLTACAAYAIVARRQLSALWSPSWQLARELAVAAPTFAGLTILAAVHWQIGTVLASRLGGETAAAEFGVVSRFLVPVTVLLWSYVSVIQPAASRLAAESFERLGEFLARCLQVTLALGLPLAAGGLLLGRELLLVLFGARYGGAAPALALLAASVIPFGVVMIASRGLIATGRQRLDLLANLAAVLSNIALNLLLIPRYGATGAAAAQLLSVTVMAAVEVGWGTRPLFALRVWRAIWTCRWPLAAMIAVIWQAQRLGFWPALVLGGLSYLGGLALIWERINPARRGAEQHRTRVLMVGDHLTKTVGGINTLLRNILHSPLAAEFEFRHIASQADEYGKLGKLALALGALVKFGALLLGWRPAMAYIHIGCSASLYRKIAFITLARLLGRRVLAHFHAGDFEQYLARQSAFGRWLIVRGIGQAGRFIAVSREMKRLLGQLWPEAEITCVPNGVKTSLFAGPRAAAGTDARVLFVGKMGGLKGEQDLLRALQQLAQTGLRFRLELVGPLSETIAAECRERGLEPLLDQLGPAPPAERVACFKRADIFALPTYAEGLPIAALEAMAAGLPVISTRVGGVPELIEDGVEGYLVAPGDVAALANRLERLISDPVERRRMGERAQAKASLFDEELMLARLGIQLRRAAQASVARAVFTRDSSVVVPLPEGD